MTVWQLSESSGVSGGQYEIPDQPVNVRPVSPVPGEGPPPGGGCQSPGRLWRCPFLSLRGLLQLRGPGLRILRRRGEQLWGGRVRGGLETWKYFSCCRSSISVIHWQTRPAGLQSTSGERTSLTLFTSSLSLEIFSGGVSSVGMEQCSISKPWSATTQRTPSPAKSPPVCTGMSSSDWWRTGTITIKTWRSSYC